MAEKDEALVVPTFKLHTTQNEYLSKQAGRPVFEDMEVVEIRMAANRETAAVYPAHEVWRIVDQADGTREPMTYAMRWPELYRKFKAGELQAQSGTPLAEAPFLTQAKRMELKALNIHTVEALAALDGQPLKMLGIGGREIKHQAQAYLAKAEGSAIETRLAAENTILKQQLADLQTQVAAINKKAAKEREESEDDAEPADDAEETDSRTDDDDDQSASPFADWGDDDLKNWIADAQGSRPKGNPSHATLVRMADELNAELAKRNEGA